MKSAVPNPHPEHMLNIRWAPSTETQLRIRERGRGSSEVEIGVCITETEGWSSELGREGERGGGFSAMLRAYVVIFLADSPHRVWMWDSCGSADPPRNLTAKRDSTVTGCDAACWPVTSTLLSLAVFSTPLQIKDGSSIADPDYGVTALLNLGWSVMWTRHARHRCWHLWVRTTTGGVRMLLWPADIILTVVCWVRESARACVPFMNTNMRHEDPSLVSGM